MPFHHFLSKTYMRSWGYSKKAVWTFNKARNIAEPRKLIYLIGQDNYHRIYPGSLFMPTEISDRMFSCVKNYSVEYNNEILESSSDLNICFPSFRDWVIRSSDNQTVDISKKIAIYKEIVSHFDDSIENDWNYKYENWWPQKLSRILTNLNSHKTNKKVPVENSDIDFLFRCFVMYDWRCQSESSSTSLAFDFVSTVIEPINQLEIPESVRYNEYDVTFLDEIKHAYYLQQYYAFLRETGQMFSQVAFYKQNLILYFHISETEPFITCDSPVFHIQHNDHIEMIFVVHPKLLISVVRKEPDNPNLYYWDYLNESAIMAYNHEIFKHGKVILGCNKDFSKYI